MGIRMLPSELVVSDDGDPRRRIIKRKGAFKAIERRVEMAPVGTWLEQIHKNNITRQRIMSNWFYNKLYLDRWKSGAFYYSFYGVPAELCEPLWTGTAAVIGNKDKKLDKVIETQCKYAEKMKSVIFKPTEEVQAAPPNTIFMCNHGFTKNGQPFLFLSNARTDKPIITEEDMDSVDVVEIAFKGPVTSKEASRCGNFERLGKIYDSMYDEKGVPYYNCAYFDYGEVVGLMRRNVNVLHTSSFWENETHDRDDWAGWVAVILKKHPSDRFPVALDASEEK